MKAQASAATTFTALYQPAYGRLMARKCYSELYCVFLEHGSTYSTSSNALKATADCYSYWIRC